MRGRASPHRLLPKLSGIVVASAAVLSACAGEQGPSPIGAEASQQQSSSAAVLPGARPVIPPHMVFAPSPGDVQHTQGGITMDTSNITRGYIMFRYEGGSASRIVVRVEKPQAPTPYDFNLRLDGEWDVFTLTRGSGTYAISVLENVEGNMFAQVFSTTETVTLEDELLPFLYPNQYVNFNAYTNAVALSAELAQSANDELDMVRLVYEFVTQNIEYDFEFALMVAEGLITTYIPDVDRTLETGRGICFDYAALMAAMLRAQHIPTRLDIGYVSGGIYHAWVEVYVEGIGWVGTVQFSGEGWSLMDPTFSAGGAPAEFVGNADNYQTVFIH